MKTTSNISTISHTKNPFALRITSKLKMLSWSLAAVLVILVPVMTTAAAGPGFNDPGFASTWNRVDKPLLDLPGGAGRGYTWGPAIEQAAQITKEPYNGSLRTVQYFDKARMEVNNPNGNPNDLFYVTTGLLVKELVTGKRQDGENTFTQAQPSEVQAAGDTNEAGGNQIAPTYASFRFVGTFGGTENGYPFRQGQAITGQINRSGQVTTFNPPEQHVITGYDSVTQHNIPDVFVNFANSSGPIWNGSADVNGKVLFDNPVYVLGRPLTEAYWVRTYVRGNEQDVLVQLYERRVLTYTPGNPEGFKVEMGNVGQHYYRWRYNTPRTILREVWETGKDLTGMKEPGRIAVDAQGNTFVITRNVNGIQKYDASGKLVTAWFDTNGLILPESLVVDSLGNVFVNFGNDKQIVKYDNNGKFLANIGSPGTGQGQYKFTAGLALDSQNNVYVMDGNYFILKFNNQGQYLTTIDLSAGLADFKKNHDGMLGSQLIVDGKGNILLIGSYLKSKNFYKGLIFEVSQQGKVINFWDDPEYSVQILALDSQGDLFVQAANQIVRLDANLKLVASWNSDLYPSGFAIDRQDTVYLAYFDQSQIKKYSLQGNFISAFGSYAKGNGQLYHPDGIAQDDQGNIYVSDTNNHRVQKFDSSGQYLLQFGTYGTGNGQFNYPAGLVVDSKGNIYVADPVNITVQKFDSTGQFLAKWTNNPVGSLESPFRMAIDGQDNIYISGGNVAPVLKYNSDGKLLGRIGYDKSGNYLLNSAGNFAVNRVPGQAGRLYILDTVGLYPINKVVVREFDSDGNLVRSLGAQDNETLNIFDPYSFAVDSFGYLYVGDVKGGFKKFSPNGDLVANWGPETYTRLTPQDIRNLTVDYQGNLLVLDFFNDRLLKLQPA